MEKEADEFALNKMIDKKIWNEIMNNLDKKHYENCMLHCHKYHNHILVIKQYNPFSLNYLFH